MKTINSSFFDEFVFSGDALMYDSSDNLLKHRKFSFSVDTGKFGKTFQSKDNRIFSFRGHDNLLQ
jgi:hypothetical protein